MSKIPYTECVFEEAGKCLANVIAMKSSEPEICMDLAMLLDENYMEHVPTEGISMKVDITSDDFMHDLQNKMQMLFNWGKQIHLCTALSEEELKEVLLNEEKYEGDYVILATGSLPVIPNIKGLQEAISDGYAYTNEKVFEDTYFPDSLGVIGGGVSGVEIAFAYALLGTKVTLLEAAPRILSMFDSDLSEKVKQTLTRKGIEVRTQIQHDACIPAQIQRKQKGFMIRTFICRLILQAFMQSEILQEMVCLLIPGQSMLKLQ